jgi:hypothetical protein
VPLKGRHSGEFRNLNILSVSLMIQPWLEKSNIVW